MKINAFYRKLLESIGLSVEKDGMITMDGQPLIVNKVPMYLYLEGVNDDIILDSKGVPFNILSENVLDGVSKPLKMLIGVFEMNLNLMVKSMGKIFLERLYTEYSYPASTMFRLEKLYKELEEATVRSKSKINELTLENYIKSILKDIDLEFATIKERHKVEFEGEQFSSGVVASYPILTALKEALEEGTKLGNSKMRKTDLKVFKAIFETFSEMLGKIYSVSNVEAISDTTAFMKAIIHVNEFIEENSDIVEDSDQFFNNFKNILTTKDIAIAQKLRKEAEMMPTVTVVDDKVKVVETARTEKPTREIRGKTKESKTDDGYVSLKEAKKLKEKKFQNRAYDYDDEDYYEEHRGRRRRRPRRVEVEVDDIDDFFEPECVDPFDDFFEAPRTRRKRIRKIPIIEDDFEEEVPWY